VSTLEVYKWFVAKEKAIYNALNMLKLHHHTFIGYMWVPADKQGIVSERLDEFGTTEFSRWNSNDDENRPIPPTNFKTNDVL